MARAGVSISGSNGFLRDITTAILERMNSGPIQTGSFINGDKEDDGNAMQRVSDLHRAFRRSGKKSFVPSQGLPQIPCILRSQVANKSYSLKG